MDLIDRLRAGLHAMTAPSGRIGQIEKVNAGWQAAWNTIFTTGMDKVFGTAAMTMPYAQHPTVHAAVSAIAQSISALPLEMFPESDEKREEPVRDSIVSELLENPSPDMDGPMLLEGTIDFMKLNGDAFWFLDGEARRGPGGPRFPTVIELWDPQRVRAKLTGSRVTSWEYQDGTDTFVAPAERVIQFKHFNPYDAVRGLPPLSAAQTAASGGWKALQYQEAFFDNNAVPAGVLTPKGEGQIIQPEAMVRLRDEFEARHMGSRKHGRIGALNAQIEFTELGLSHKDMDFPVWLDAASAFILMVFKVPPAVAGIQKDANYNESVHQSKRFWYNHLPLVHYIERRIKQRLCRQYGIPETPYFKTEMIKSLTEDQESLSNQARNYWNMGVPFAEINERLELGFPADGPAAETGFIPFSLVNADEQAMAPARDATGGPAQGAGNAGGQNQPGDESTVADDPMQGKALANPTGREFQRTLSWRTLISKVRDEERAFSWRVAQHFSGLKMEVLTKLRGRKSIKASTDINVETLLFDDKKAEADLKKRVEPLYKSAIQKGAETVIRELNIQIDFSFLSPGVQKFLSEKMFEIHDLIDGPLTEDLRATLTDGINQGESVQKIADRVNEVFSVSRSRAERIARTEVAESFNGGRYATMKEAGVERIEWLSARDNRVRDSHQEVDGEVIVLGDKFSNGLLYPLDPAGPPEEIVNCRCVSVPVA